MSTSSAETGTPTPGRIPHLVVAGVAAVAVVVPAAPPPPSTTMDPMTTADPALDTSSYQVCGVRIDAHQIPSATDTVLSWRGDGQGRAVHLCNAYTLSLARTDAALRDLLNRGDLNLTDGMPLVWIGRKLGFRHMAERVYGPDLMLSVVDRGRAVGTKHYLYGSTPEVIDKLVANLRERFPGVDIVGAESPPFRPLTPEEDDAMVERLTASGADVVWVGLGTPRQDQFVDRYASRIPATLMAVGAAFDFHAGNKKQAPAILQKAGLEWVFRLVTEPRRLWKRYLIGNTSFVWGVLRDRPRRVSRTTR